jgi:hypothetical protein
MMKRDYDVLFYGRCAAESKLCGKEWFSPHLK